ncbi:uncharacterized protein [Haliotis asinina]|uniref:uncharacterized protein n=1 Tax=Haliotis asinina TaxID=109174 RepID=UPI0035321F83
MAGKKCAAEQDFQNCRIVSLEWTTMRLNVALVTLAMVAVTFAQDPTQSGIGRCLWNTFMAFPTVNLEDKPCHERLSLLLCITHENAVVVHSTKMKNRESNSGSKETTDYVLCLSAPAAGFFKCELNMEKKKCDAEEVFPNCQATSLEWTTCTCPPTTKCTLEENDGTCRYSCEPVAFENEDNNAGMGPGNGIA